MTEEKKYTEREVVLRQRAAFEGAINSYASCVQDESMRGWMIQDAPLRARMKYTLPIRMRGVRVTLSDGATIWREGDYIRVYATHKDYTTLLTGRGALPVEPTAEDFRQIARLLDDEQEPVPEDET